MNFKNASKYLLPVGAALLTLVSTVVNSKHQEVKMNETIEKKVAEALAEKAKEV